MAETRPRLGVVIGSTRDARFADKPAEWLMENLKDDDHFDAELVDLRDFNLPFFNEMASNMQVPSQDANAVAWQQKIAEFDAYIFVAAEYNYSMTGALKNALDQAYNEWNRKPFGVLGYGGLGAARAVQDLRGVGVALQMVPVSAGVHIGGGEFMAVHPLGKNEPMSAIEDILKPSLGAMLDQLEWWTAATKGPREQTYGQGGPRAMAAAEAQKAPTGQETK